jgi:hypothetical protein
MYGPAVRRKRLALEASIATFERSFDAAGWGAAAFNHKIIDIAQRNLPRGLTKIRAASTSQNP